jgi:branched-subunit amino acid ABC-type transport system permease component
VERQSEKSPVGPLRASALALLILGFLVLVTLAASGARETGHAHLAERQVPNTLQDSWVTLMTIAYAVVIVAVLVTVFRRRDRWEDPRSRWLQNFLVIVLVMALLTGAGFWAVRHGHFRAQSQAQQKQQGKQGQAQGGKPGALKPLPARHAQFQWPLALALAGVVLLGGVWLLVRRSRSPESSEAVGVEEELAAAIGSTIDDLRNERDARRAVIAAYASMESILASHDLARNGPEAPYEYLARVLHMLDVRESAVRSLTELFEYAKFSDHEIDRTMKDRAIESLVAVKEDLQLRQELVA